MGVIKPTKSGRTYSIWKLLMNFVIFSSDKILKEDFDPGLRISMINSCWISIESFMKECLYWQIMSEYGNMSIPKRYKYREGCLQKMKSIFKSKEELEMLKFQVELKLKDDFANEALRSSWYPALKICNELNLKIEKNIPQWAFLQNLYRLRNGLTHGQTIKILKANFDHINDEVSKEYIKALRYLNGKKIINLKRLIEHQDIRDFLNQELTDFVIDETAKAFDEIAEVFEKSYTSAQWKQMRN